MGYVDWNQIQNEWLCQIPKTNKVAFIIIILASYVVIE